MNARLGLAGGNPPPPPPPPPPPTDNTAPVIALGAPADGSTQPANTQLTVTANISDPDDAVASAVMVWEYNGQVLNFDCASPPSGFTCTHNGASYSWTLSVGSGPRAWTIKATDSHGNVTTSARRTLTLGSGQPPPPPPPPNGPTVQFDAPAAGTTYSAGSSITIQVTATDQSSAIASAQLRWRSPSGDALFDLSQVSATDWAATLQLSSAAVAGTRNLVVTVTDGNGTKASTPSLVIRVQ